MSGASGQRAVARCDALGQGRFSDHAQHLFRPFLGPAHRATLKQVDAWMQDAGMSTRIDAAGSLIGRLASTAPNVRTLMIGSHLDSVRDAGRYDGPLGVMLGIECVAAFTAAGRSLPFAIEVIGFGDEEGSRFPAAMLGSRAMAGQVTPDMLAISDAEGVSLDQALREIGLTAADLPTARRDAAELIGFFEAHIEQGPVLEADGLALGLVTAIAAQRRFEVAVSGAAGHAGTNAMRLRKDALAAAAEMVLAIEGVARGGPPDLVATVGRLTVLPGAANVVPGRVEFSIDVRAGAMALRDEAAAACLDAIDAIAAARGVGVESRLIHDLPAAPCDAAMMAALAEALTRIGQPVRRLVSGAGHDAMALARITPMAMLFVRCKGGISHNPAESVSVEDADLALRAMLAFVETLAERYDG